MEANGGVEMDFDRIKFDPQILGGRASIRGMRIPVSVIVGQLANGATFEEVLAGYPDLEREDIQLHRSVIACLGFWTEQFTNLRDDTTVEFG